MSLAQAGRSEHRVGQLGRVSLSERSTSVPAGWVHEADTLGGAVGGFSAA